MSNFEVSYGPPVKATRFGAGRTAIYPWAKMPEPEQDEHGAPLYSQFFVPGKTTKKFSSVAQAAGKRHNCKFAVRSAELEGVAGVIVQRVF